MTTERIIVEPRLLKEQHKRLLDHIAKISVNLRPATLMRDTLEMRLGLCEFAGVLNIHLAMEDEGVYPRLLDHLDPEIRLLARRFVDEMGDLSADFKEYLAVWTGPQKIDDDPEGFIRETALMIGVLRARIYREDNELYRLLSK